jgi:hypothetical protein
MVNCHDIFTDVSCHHFIKQATLFFRIVWPCIVTNSLWIKPTDALNSNFVGITTLHVWGSLSARHQEFLAVHRHWYISCSFDDRLLPGVGWNRSSIPFLVANDHQNCMKCTAKNSWRWAERPPETCRVAVGFIHKEATLSLQHYSQQPMRSHYYNPPTHFQ